MTLLVMFVVEVPLAVMGLSVAVAVMDPAPAGAAATEADTGAGAGNQGVAERVGLHLIGLRQVRRHAGDRDAVGERHRIGAKDEPGARVPAEGDLGRVVVDHVVVRVVRGNGRVFGYTGRCRRGVHPHCVVGNAARRRGHAEGDALDRERRAVENLCVDLVDAAGERGLVRHRGLAGAVGLGDAVTGVAHGAR